MVKYLIMVSLVLLVAIATACDQQSEQTPSPQSPDQLGAGTDEPVTTTAPPTEESAYPDPASSGYPPPVQDSGPAYPIPESRNELSAVMEEVPTPSSGAEGTVTGILLVEEEQLLPVSDVILYLGSVVMLDDGRPGMSSLDRTSAPKATTNLVGQFIFKDVPSGQYTLVLDQITSAFLLNAPEGGDLIIEVTGGQVIDLGELQYDALPVTLGN